MTNEQDVRNRIARLERQLLRLKVSALILFTVLALIGLCSANWKPVQADQPSDRILRARGLIIEDEAGRERILLGAPVPLVQNRVRTDPARVKELWAKRYPDPNRYMDWYKDYRHATNGLLILDEKGFDRIALGDPVPDPNIGKRIGPSTGVVINDEQGLERSGYGLLKVEGRYRVVIGLDSAQGREGLTLRLYDEGPVGITVQDGKHLVLLGSAPSTERLTGIAGSFHGLLVRGAEGVRFIANAAAEK